MTIKSLQSYLPKFGPFIIAEIGVNYYDHAKDIGISVLEAAQLMIDQAAESGAHAAKFQTYKAGKLASKNSPAYWDQSEEPTTSQFELFSKFDHFGEAEYKHLAAYCEQAGIMFLSTPFDFEAADYLEDLMPFYKISSSDLSNLPFIEHQAKKGKPVLLSTGAASIGEIEAAVRTIEASGNHEICIMHCVLDYPTNNENANLNMIKHLKEVFPEYIIGYSDHTRPDPSMMIVSTAFMFGAVMVEKHFTLNKELSGNDHYHAMDPDDLKRFSQNIKTLSEVLGQYRKEPLACEQAARAQARRSLVLTHDLPAGTAITQDMLTYKRPGTGISPTHLNLVLGRVTKQALEADHILSWQDL
jgi:sialic acid synthase SpsE